MAGWVISRQGCGMRVYVCVCKCSQVCSACVHLSDVYVCVYGAIR